MILEISNISGEPLQSQIAGQIKAQILKGVLKSGYALPSIRVLAREQRVSVITVQRAYESLEHDGLIISQPAKGFFVAEINENDRLEIARRSFAEKFTPIAATAIKEGLTKQDISAIVNMITSEQTFKNNLRENYGKSI